MSTKKYILWTGGWDSTYRMVELSRMDIDVFPIYVMDTTRPSLKIEMDTIKKLWNQLCEDSRTIAKIEPVTWIRDDEIPKNDAITKAYERIHKEVLFGSQYEYIARLAIKYPGIEVGIEKPNGEISGCYEAIYKFGKLIKGNDIYVIDKGKCTQDLRLLFENVSFPIIDKTEIEMLQNIKKWDYVEFMKGIHFCYRPRHNQPCGICRPCQQKMECGMEILLPKEAHFRYRVYKSFLFVRPFYRKLRNLCNRIIKRGAV